MRSEEGKFQNSRRIQGDSGEEKIQGGRVKFKENSRRIQGCINPGEKKFHKIPLNISP